MSNETITPPSIDQENVPNPWDFSSEAQDTEPTVTAHDTEPSTMDFGGEPDLLIRDSYAVVEKIEQFSDVTDDTWDFAVPEAEKQGKVIKPVGASTTYNRLAEASGNATAEWTDVEDFLDAGTLEAIDTRMQAARKEPVVAEKQMQSLHQALLNEAVSIKAQEVFSQTNSSEKEKSSNKTKRIRTFGRGVLGRLRR